MFICQVGYPAWQDTEDTEFYKTKSSESRVLINTDPDQSFEKKSARDPTLRDNMGPDPEGSNIVDSTDLDSLHGRCILPSI